jgi:hypothetical protein
LFVYGFFDDGPAQKTVLAIAVDVAMVLRRLALRQLKWTRESRVDQTFLGFSFRDLDAIRAVMYRYDARELPKAEPRPVPDLTDEIWPPVRRPPDWTGVA